MLDYDFCGDDAFCRGAIIDEIAQLRMSRGYEGNLPLPGVVADSWKRCLTDYNLTPDRVPRAEVLPRYRFKDLEKDYEDLLAVAEPEIEKLFLRLVDSEYLVSLASPAGVMMLFRCDHQFLGDMSNLGVLPGSVWSEERQGTNGVGTCLRAGRSVAIAGKQHYGLATQALSCMAAPVLGRRDMPLGVINVTTARVVDDRSNRVILDIVERSARRIENRYFARLHRDSHLLRLFHGIDSTDLAEEGRVAIDDNGLIVDVSSQAGALTGRSADELIGMRVEEILNLDLPLADLRPDKTYMVPIPGKNLQARLSHPESNRSRPVVAAASDASGRSEITTTALQNAEPVDKSFRIDPTISLMLERAKKLYQSGIPLIVGGETGSGKTAFAQVVARSQPYGEMQTLFIDCAAVSRQQVGAAIFHPQLLHNPICLILDRLEELDEPGQIALQVLMESREQRGVQRFGIIALIDGDFDRLAKSGRFKDSLLHRLKGGTFFLPPLRNHPDLAGMIYDLLKMECCDIGRSELELCEEAKLVLMNYHWPGNLRELRNAIRHAVVLAGESTVNLEHLPEDLVSEIARTDLTARSQSQVSRIEAALRHNGGNVSLTARYLGVSRATLYRKIQIQKSREKASGLTPDRQIRSVPCPTPKAAPQTGAATDIKT